MSDRPIPGQDNEPTATTGNGVWSPAQVVRAFAERVAAGTLSVPTVAEVMSREVCAVAPDTSLETAARLMVSRKISGAPVVRDGAPIGVVSLADLADPDRARGRGEGYPIFYEVSGGEIVAWGEPLVAEEGSVGDVMSPFVLSIESSATIIEASHRVLAERVHRLLVRDGTDLVGIVTVTDLLRGFAGLLSYYLARGTSFGAPLRGPGAGDRGRTWW
jgi:CBS domain-containing protein